MFKPSDKIVCVKEADGLILNRVYIIAFTSKILVGDNSVHNTISLIGINNHGFSPDIFVNFSEFRRMKLLKIKTKLNG
jgi:hypothetical protein